MQLCGLIADKTRKKYVFFDKKVFKLIFILTFAEWEIVANILIVN